MGILKGAAAWIVALELPAGFAVCELGDQMLSGKVATPAVDFYKRLGCGRYVSIDGNGRGVLTWDLNQPIRPRPEPFDLVTDCGTGEHIFDQAQVWRTLHELARPGGYILIDRPADGYGDHAFYSISTGLLEDLAHANGYTIRELVTEPTARGTLIRVLLQTAPRPRVFVIPQQKRYRPMLLRTGVA